MHQCDRPREIAPLKTLAYRAIGLFPPVWREAIAEHFLRRPNTPGPAAEHVVQYLLCAARRSQGRVKRSEATIVQGADFFYARQYRQYFNAVMGAFAMTATEALAASAGPLEGHFWRRHRKTYAALIEAKAGAAPIFVLGRETVAIPLMLPMLQETQMESLRNWLFGKASMPEPYRAIAAGLEVRSGDPAVRAYERSADGALLELADAVLQSKRLALLALHPRDPDAMGLHVTLFGVDIVEPDQLQKDYGLERGALELYRAAVRVAQKKLFFCVGGTEEVFTQCSQNLFIKRPAAALPDRPLHEKRAWDPRQGLEQLLATQFETVQVSVSASGLPGASPRNGDIGKAAFLGRRGTQPLILIPYHAGNSIHGHAAKLWSNPYGSLVISDDHAALSRIMISGKAWIASHAEVEGEFPGIAGASLIAEGRRRGHGAVPEYWFIQEVRKLVQQSEPLSANLLDPARPACSINAGGTAHHGKKPAYFDADCLPPYDMKLQHERETKGRPRAPSGAEYRAWRQSVAQALEARKAHLSQIVDNGDGIIPGYRAAL